MAIRTYTDLAEQSKNWQHDSVPMTGGARASFAFWQVSQPRGHVLIVPGRNERPLKYTEVASEWADRGIQALCLSPEPEITDFNNYVDEFDHVFKAVWLPHVKDDFAVVQGHSTGAQTAARCLATGQKNIKGADALIMSAPFAGMNYRVPHIPKAVAAMVTSLMGTIKPHDFALGQKAYDRDKWQFEGNRWTSDAERYGWMQDMFDKHPEFAPHGAKWGWVLAAQRSCALLDRAIDKLAIPHLVLATPNDRAVDGLSQNKFKQSTRVDFPESGHEIFMEQDAIRQKAWKAIDDFTFRIRQSKALSL